MIKETFIILSSAPWRLDFPYCFILVSVVVFCPIITGQFSSGDSPSLARQWQTRGRHSLVFHWWRNRKDDLSHLPTSPTPVWPLSSPITASRQVSRHWGVMQLIRNNYISHLAPSWIFEILNKCQSHYRWTCELWRRCLPLLWPVWWLSRAGGPVT